MTKDFNHFLEVVKHGIRSGELKVENESHSLNYLDCAIQWAIGKGEEDLGMRLMTTEDVYKLIYVYCGEDVWDKADEIVISW